MGISKIYLPCYILRDVLLHQEKDINDFYAQYSDSEMLRK